LLDELRLQTYAFILDVGSAGDLLYQAGSSGRIELAHSSSRLESDIVVSTHQGAGWLTKGAGRGLPRVHQTAQPTDRVDSAD
jgi:hypothetical protein